MSLFKLWLTTLLSCLKTASSIVLMKPMMNFLENAEVQAKVKELWKDW